MHTDPRHDDTTTEPGAWRAVLGALSLGTLGCGVLALALGCRGLGDGPPAASAPTAAERELSLALDAWRDAERLGEVDESIAEPARARAKQHLARARQAAPGWIPAERLWDEAERGELRALDAYAARLEDLRRDGATAVELYLAGRLEGVDGVQRFRQAVVLDRDCAWAHHALALDHELAGRGSRALAAQRRAWKRARGAFEIGFFARRLARIEERFGRPERGRRVLRDALERLPGTGRERAEVVWQLTRSELAATEPDVFERGFERALGVLATQSLLRRELAELVAAASQPVPGRSARGREALVRDAWSSGPNAEVYREHLATVLAEGVAAVADELADAALHRGGAAVRLAGFREGRGREAVEGWLAALPRACIDPDGLPAHAPLRRVVEAVRAHEPGHEGGLELARALLEVGWTGEAREVLRRLLADHPAEPELTGPVAALDRRAAAAEGLIAELDELLAALFEVRPSYSGRPVGDLEAPPEQPLSADLDELLERVARVFERHGPAAGIDPLPDVRATPRVRYGPLAEVTIPSPTFVARDEAVGHGSAGEPVPGLPAALLAIGRVGMFGEGLGVPTDGVVLRLVGTREIEGEHVGVPFSGLVIYGEGADALGARQRAGGAIAGAALHEGYWVDLDAERARLARWTDLDARFVGDDAARATELLAARSGLALRTPAAEISLRRLERRSLHPVLDTADLVRLAVLTERAESGRAVGERIDLDELMTVVETHEQGHLCDRTRYLPLGEHPWKALGFALGEGLSPAAIEEELEYRAEWTALAAAPEPRLVLAELLDFAAADGRGHGSHGKAYVRLTEDLLSELDRRLARGDHEDLPIDPDRTLVHQLHRLPGEVVRELALAVEP